MYRGPWCALHRPCCLDSPDDGVGAKARPKRAIHRRAPAVKRPRVTTVDSGLPGTDASCYLTQPVSFWGRPFAQASADKRFAVTEGRQRGRWKKVSDFSNTRRRKRGYKV